MQPSPGALSATSDFHCPTSTFVTITSVSGRRRAPPAPHAAGAGLERIRASASTVLPIPIFSEDATAVAQRRRVGEGDATSRQLRHDHAAAQLRLQQVLEAVCGALAREHDGERLALVLGE